MKLSKRDAKKQQRLKDMQDKFNSLDKNKQQKVVTGMRRRLEKQSKHMKKRYERMARRLDRWPLANPLLAEHQVRSPAWWDDFPGNGLPLDGGPFADAAPVAFLDMVDNRAAGLLSDGSQLGTCECEKEQSEGSTVKSDSCIEQVRAPEGKAQVQQTAQKSEHGCSSVVVSVICNLIIAVLDFAASVIGKSSVMFAEGIHSLVDAGDGLLVLLGVKLAAKPADAKHPFGYGKELYFWTMLVSLVIFVIGGGMALYEGMRSIAEAAAGEVVMGDPTLAYIVLGATLVIEGFSLRVALKNFNQARGDESFVEFIKRAKDPTAFIVVLEDGASELGVAAALLATIVGHATGNAYLDGAASLFIGALLVIVAAIILANTRKMLIGTGVEEDEAAAIRKIAASEPEVASCEKVQTLFMGTNELIVIVYLKYASGLSREAVQKAERAIESKIRATLPQTKLFLTKSLSNA